EHGGVCRRHRDRARSQGTLGDERVAGERGRVPGHAPAPREHAGDLPGGDRSLAASDGQRRSVAGYLRAVRKEKTGKIKNSPSTARLIEGERTIGWRAALIELDIAYPGRIK
ncbi:hypothetical protein, partial [Nonomuraea sp. JJY05]|uniref:hypothetical protein n=1 Tax=Nonomuraea sp. JJY05 TaxID=3350255 RepID=UPI00373F0FA2